MNLFSPKAVEAEGRGALKESIRVAVSAGVAKLPGLEYKLTTGNLPAVFFEPDRCPVAIGLALLLSETCWEFKLLGVQYGL